MAIDERTRLRFATAAAHFGPGAARLRAGLRRDGFGVFEDLVQGLTPGQLDELDYMVEGLQTFNVGVVLLGDDAYPRQLASLGSPPPLLFFRGPEGLFHHQSFSVCGSRSATSAGLHASRASAEVLAKRNIQVVSGYARGVDMAAHIGALAAGGSTTIVLAEGIDRFRVRQGEFARVWDEDRALVISQFAPSMTWRAASAMARNSVISGLGRALLVVEARETGGTIAAGVGALKKSLPVLVLEAGTDAPGNRVLLDRGATAVSSRAELLHYLDTQARSAGPAQMILH